MSKNCTTIESEIFHDDDKMFFEVGATGLTDLEIYHGCEYHPPEVGADGVWNGRGWRDMPGTDDDIKRFNFFLYRRGMYVIGRNHFRDNTAISFERKQGAYKDDSYKSGVKQGEGA